MTLKEYLTRLEVIVQALQHSGGESLWGHSTSVFVSGNPPTFTDRKPPRIAFSVSGGNPHGDDGEFLWFYRLEAEIEIVAQGDSVGRGAVMGDHQVAANDTIGAGLADIAQAVAKATAIIDTKGEAINTWGRCIDMGAITWDGRIGRVTLFYEALCETS